jgi:hypothetical protein
VLPVGQEDVATAAEILGMSLQLAPQRGQRFQVGFVCYRHQEIRIPGIDLIGDKRADEGDASNASDAASRAHKDEHFLQ